MEGTKTKYYQITELANLLEMTPRTIRYYEEIGLLNSIKRTEEGRRVYTDQDFQHLKFLKRLKHLGLTLSEMFELEEIHQFHRRNKRELPRLYELLDHHAAKIDERINSLMRLKEDILNYQKKVLQKLNTENGLLKGEDKHERSGHHQCRSNSYR
jgi:DNA-binding transcriptional MerR regulator